MRAVLVVFFMLGDGIVLIVPGMGFVFIVPAVGCVLIMPAVGLVRIVPSMVGFVCWFLSVPVVRWAGITFI
jgi:hypothetical protein